MREREIKREKEIERGGEIEIEIERERGGGGGGRTTGSFEPRRCGRRASHAGGVCGGEVWVYESLNCKRFYSFSSSVSFARGELRWRCLRWSNSRVRQFLELRISNTPGVVCGGEVYESLN